MSGIMGAMIQAQIPFTPVITTINTTGAGSISLGSGTYQFECYGGGAGGAVSGYTFWSNGSGAWKRTNSITLLVTTTVYYYVAPQSDVGDNKPGYDTWINVVSNAAPTLATQGCLAKGGNVGNSTTPGTGGQDASGVGDTGYSGTSGTRVDFLAGPNDGANYTGPGGPGGAGPTGSGGVAPGNGDLGTGNIGNDGGHGEVSNGVSTITAATNPVAPGGAGACGIFGFGTLGAQGQIIITQTA